MAVTVVAPGLQQLKGELDTAFRAGLKPQDRQPLRPHITLVNKVSAALAAQQYAALQDEFKPFTGRAAGLALYRYAGGPWAYVATHLFNDSLSSGPV